MSEPETEPTEPTEPTEAEPVTDEPGPSDDEAAEAEEAEQADEEADEPAPTSEPEAPQSGVSEQEWDKRFQKGEKAAAAYARRISDIYEEAVVDLIECPLCPGIHKGFVNVNDAGKVPADVTNAVTMFLGYAVEAEYQQSGQVSTCGNCGGEGKVLTGSKVAKYRTMTCPPCKGYGFTPPPGDSPNGDVQVEGVVTGPTMVPSGAGVPDTDPSGEPRLLPDGRENPNYGKWPQYKVPIEPWGQTAGLTVQDAVS